jgi:hypothetical protein
VGFAVLFRRDSTAIAHVRRACARRAGREVALVMLGRVYILGLRSTRCALVRSELSGWLGQLILHACMSDCI